MTITEMRVHMDCAGCEQKVKCAIQKMKGVDNVDIEMNIQKVTVSGWADQKKILKTVRKTGRRAELWEMPYNPEIQSRFNGPVNYHAPQPSSSYNYYKHGYDSSSQGYYHHYATSSSLAFGHQTGAAFSDENPHACSIM